MIATANTAKPLSLWRGLAALAATLFLTTVLSACGQATPPNNNSPLHIATKNKIERGQYLAKAGNCATCHTRVGQAEFSGGRSIPTPFGEVISSNITSDTTTGLGNWSDDDFWQALHHGKSRNGRSLYPAFPYPSYSLITRDDSDALFAYLQTIPAVEHTPPAHQLRFPYSSQLALNIWRALYFEPQLYIADESQSDTWNRGAYLVKGLGHCSACHTPRGILGNSDSARSLAGADIEALGWHAPAIATGELSTGQQEELVKLLKAGINKRDVMSGPMAEVVAHSLQHLKNSDLSAMVEYLSTLPAKSHPSTTVVLKTQKQDQEPFPLGATLYEEHCSDCHGKNGLGEPYRFPALAGNRAVMAASANNAIRSVMLGGYGASTADRPRPFGMPAFAHLFSDQEAAAVINYIRNAWGNQAPAVRANDVRQR